MNKSDTEHKKGTHNWINEGVLIASAPVIGYLFALLYERSYSQYFGIPYDIIRIESSSILVSTGIVLLTCIPSLFLTVFFYFLSGRIKRYIPLFLYPTLIVASYALFNWGCGVWSWRKLFIVVLYIVVPFLGIVLIIEIVEVLLIKLKKTERGCREPFVNLDINFNEVVWRNVFRYVILIVYLLTAYGVPIAAGDMIARRKTAFYVLDGKPETAIIKIYDNNVICAPFDRGSKIISNKIIVFSLSSRDKLIMREEKIGPLRPVSHVEFMKQTMKTKNK